jgi:RNA polymerase sigma factor (sigma-70 family)
MLQAAVSDISGGVGRRRPRAVSAVPSERSVLEPWLYSRPLLLRLCARLSRGNLAEAEDLASEACLRAMEADRSGLRVRDPISFSVTIIANLGRDHRRCACRNCTIEPAPDFQWSLVSKAPRPDEQMFTRESLALALEVLDRVSINQRLAFLLRAEGADYSCIARRVGTTEQNARKLVQVARAKVHASE